MNKNTLAYTVATNASISKAKADQIVKTVFDEVAKALRNGEEVSVHAFGLFHVGDTPARTGRNPQTGEPLDIPAGKRIKFKPSKSLRDMVK